MSNGYQELRDIHRLAQGAVVDFDKGEYPSRTLIARIREIAGCFPKFGNDNTYIGYARFRHREDNQQPYLSICNSDDEGAFPIYRHPKRVAVPPEPAAEPPRLFGEFGSLRAPAAPAAPEPQWGCIACDADHPDPECKACRGNGITVIG